MTLTKKLQIAFCPPEFQSLRLAMRGEPINATYLLQSHIARGLLSRGHRLTYISQRDLGDNVCTTDLEKPILATLTWADSVPFNLLKKITWRVQQLFHVPYLNIFTNLRLYNACLQCLPGHNMVYERNGLYRNGVAMACKRLRIPYVLFVEADEILEHDYMAHPLRGLLRWNARRQFRYNLMAADRVICVSEPLKNHLVSKWNISPDKILVFSNGVDVQQFRPDPVAGTEIRKMLSMTTNPIILFVGNFYEWHDVSTVLDSFPGILAEYSNARLILVGDGAMREAMEQRVVALGISYAVKFMGLIPHTDVPRYMACADIAVVPYPHMSQENWLSPLKLFEYMASGKAIVASSVGQVVDVIRDGQNGILVPPGDVSAMADAVKRLIRDQDLREHLGQQARDDAEVHHSWEQYISKLENVFLDVIGSTKIIGIHE